MCLSDSFPLVQFDPKQHQILSLLQIDLSEYTEKLEEIVIPFHCVDTIEDSDLNVGRNQSQMKENWVNLN